MTNLPEDIFQDTYGKVKKLIVTKKLSPGQLITDQRLTHTLNINDGTIPVVLLQLREESLLVGEPESGLTVRELSEIEISDLFDCRMAIETMTVKLFTKNAPQSKIDGLRHLLVPFEKGPQSLYVFHKIDCYFHEYIAKNCGNSMLYNLFKTAKTTSLMDLVGISRPLNMVMQEHLNLVSAMHQRDEHMAVEAITVHLENSRKSHLN
ncbi:GntR family transcriptional regulator [Maribacter sp. LLG6340-A2]|uniref:GntR family transcriptional regulator n=1 Tax=Maribacter sp. LLG6340-A2 TaxID=3160834 RepID=UPI003865538E